MPHHTRRHAHLICCRGTNESAHAVWFTLRDTNKLGHGFDLKSYKRLLFLVRIRYGNSCCNEKIILQSHLHQNGNSKSHSNSRSSSISSSNFIPNRKQWTSYMSKVTTSVNWYTLYFLLVVTKEAEGSSCWQPKEWPRSTVVGCPPVQRTRFMIYEPPIFYQKMTGWYKIPCTT